MSLDTCELLSYMCRSHNWATCAVRNWMGCPFCPPGKTTDCRKIHMVDWRYVENNLIHNDKGIMSFTGWVKPRYQVADHPPKDAGKGPEGE